MPYMGHVSLIGQELVKFLIRCPPDLWEQIHDSFILSEWEAFVEGSLRETKDRDTKPLAGGKPMPTATGADASKSDADDSSDEEDEGGSLAMHKFGEPLTRTVAQDGYNNRGDGFESYEDRQESGDEDEDGHGDWVGSLQVYVGVC
jgi:SIT4-associating protein SAP185/190